MQALFAERETLEYGEVVFFGSAAGMKLVWFNMSWIWGFGKIY
jgi:hypothetical protein